MKSNRINYVIVGVFMLAMLVGLIGAVAMLTGRTGAADAYYTVYNNVTGIKFGTQVLYEGYPVGQVEDVTPIEEDGRMRFRVDMSVRQGWSIPDDSVAQVAAPGLLSAITVNIEAGKSPTGLAPGERIKGQAAVNLFAVTTSVANDVGELTVTGIWPLLDNINRAVDSFGLLLEEDAQVLTRELTALTLDLAQRAPKIADNIEVLVDKMNKSTDQLQAFLNPKNREKLEADPRQHGHRRRRLRPIDRRVERDAPGPGQGPGLGRHGHRRQPPVRGEIRRRSSLRRRFHCPPHRFDEPKPGRGGPKHV